MADDVQEMPLMFTLTLDDDGSPMHHQQYLRIPLSQTKSIFRWILPPGSLASIDTPASLTTNYPVTGSFSRTTFHHLGFEQDPRLLNAYCDIVMDQPGVYEYQVVYGDKQKRARNAGRLVVEPRLTKADGSLLPLDSLMIQSIVPKWMGPMDQWDAFFQASQDAGYNMIHFVPMQQRGASNSPYSIADQLTFADDLFQDPSLPREKRLELVQSALHRLYQTYDTLALSDIVWNHTSDNSAFLLDHPEAGYNLVNSPHLVPAYELDTALIELSGQMEQHGLAAQITSTKDIDTIMTYIRQHVLPDLRLYEFKIINVQAAKDAFRRFLITATTPHLRDDHHAIANLSLHQQALLALKQPIVLDGHLGSRFHKTIDYVAVLPVVLAMARCDNIDHPDQLIHTLGQLIDELNLPWYKEYDEDVHIALDGIKNRLIFTRLADNGPQFGPISTNAPLIETYFTRLHYPNSPHEPGSLVLANNGWIWNADPLLDFASAKSSAYLRRQVIVWGDCVKLRYGQGPQDNPWLWQHMTAYTEQVAKLFHGIRIDNCHSTPIHVAQYLLDKARAVRPDLYVLAELFTGSAEKDNVFVANLGIHALIREAMQAWDPHELSRLVHRHGGKPVGSMDSDMMWEKMAYGHHGMDQVLRIPLLHGSNPRALFMDCTHDNETPAQKRLPQDALPNAGVVSFSDCATGSVKGYDELFPKLLDIVTETRPYATPDPTAGIVPVKKRLQQLHLEMALERYHEVHVHQENDYLLVHRQRAGLQDGYLLIARTAFANNAPTGHSPIRLARTKADFVFGASLSVSAPSNSTSDKQVLHGLPSQLTWLDAPPLVPDNNHVRIDLNPANFPPGSIMVFKTSLLPETNTDTIKAFVNDMASEVVQSLSLVDCNVVLYRCQSEETTTVGDGVYNIPGFGPLVYAGLQGWLTVLDPIIRSNDLGHPVCDNLRQGPWALDYVVHRLDKHLPTYPELKPLRDWLRSRMDRVKQLPDFLVPKYFAMVIQTAHHHVYCHALSLMTPVTRHEPFLERLAMTSVQMLGKVPNAGLDPRDPTPSLAAGLPHFTDGPFRTWGRDVFISLRGLLLVTGRYDEARQHILGFASTLKHGLIPNLLDGGNQPRFNARDAAWFFMQAIQDYCHMTPEGIAILTSPVPRRFPMDPNDPFVPVDQGYQDESTLAEIMQEILQRHAAGIHFREYNAGPAIDRQMSDQGFNIDIHVDWTSGFPLGGNAFNCGTWMDKMGESEKAHNKGLPGTSRDGAPIEIVGLLKSALRWIIQLHNDGHYPWTHVTNQEGKQVSFEQWNQLIQDQFEPKFYIPLDPAEDDQYDLDSTIVHRRGMYKDVYGATNPYTEYQFRPNFACAMVVAPELFDRQHAQAALTLANEVLLGPLGMRTLDPDDREYHPYYNNGDDSDDILVAKGRNYHQGPEWLWPTGHFLRAAHAFGVLDLAAIARILRAHRREIETSPWRGLPELTNKDGAVCHDSCPTQAWSSSTLLDLLDELIQP
ncbi:glycogen debranching enzyme [Hesseltinella vesiculosa]|uniref:Glycogen debranching enzyme n=1 Tax=Hesseltinella vesiculosa TaxID=101127 RepID=A0A1X2G9N9_9FUNG|nr:glycogen debranching enzyme [Hesseltinella vesiculosa]